MSQQAGAAPSQPAGHSLAAPTSQPRFCSPILSALSPVPARSLFFPSSNNLAHQQTSAPLTNFATAPFSFDRAPVAPTVAFFCFIFSSPFFPNHRQQSSLLTLHCPLGCIFDALTGNKTAFDRAPTRQHRPIPPLSTALLVQQAVERISCCVRHRGLLTPPPPAQAFAVVIRQPHLVDNSKSDALFIMSGKLDKPLDEIVSAQRRSATRRSTRRPAGRPAINAPVGGIQKTTRPARGAVAKAAPAKAAAVSGESKVIVSNLVRLFSPDIAVNAAR